MFLLTATKTKAWAATIVAVLFLACGVKNGFSLSQEPIWQRRHQSSNTPDVDAVIGSSRRNLFIQSALSSTTILFFPRTARARSGIVVEGNIVFGDDSIMSQKAHGTTNQSVQSDLRFGVSNKLADKICSYTRHFAELGGYFMKETSFEDVVMEAKGEPITFYDSVTGKPLFVAPINRSPDDFLKESESHGWPSFRDEEVVWENVRVLKSSGETVSVDGTHLGHNLPDRQGNRYCINVVSIAGNAAVA